MLGCADDVHLKLLEPKTDDAGVSAPDVDRRDAAGDPAPADAALGDAPSEPHDARPGAEHDRAGQPPLLHRYDFSGAGTLIVDHVGGANGEALGGASLDGGGALFLDGVDDYVNLPNGLISANDSLTISTWITWHGGRCWQRIFDFGASFMGEDVAGYASHSLFLTPATCSSSHFGTVSEQVLLAMLHVGNRAETLEGLAPLATEERIQVDLVVNGPAATVSLYVDGSLHAERTGFGLRPTEVSDQNDWLGRSQWPQDPTLHGTLHELRIYGGALTPEQLAQQHAAGPDVL